MRPFRVLGVQQIALGAPDKSKLLPLWVELLDIPQVGSFTSADENVDEVILRVGDELRGVEIDLMQPLDPTRSPRPDRPALNHIGLWVDDLRAAFDWLTERGVRFTSGGLRRGAAGHLVGFIHPRPSPDAPICGEGALIELVQAPPAVLAAFASAAPLAP